MIAVVVLLSGFMTTLAGAFIRIRDDGASNALVHAWCGVQPPLQFAARLEEHCPGCGVMAAGLGVMAVSPLLLVRPAIRLPTRVPRQVK